MNRLASEQELELDRVVRDGLCTRPPSGANAQSIEAAATLIIVADALHKAIPVERRPHRGEAAERRVRAALEIVRGDLEPWERLRAAARILQEGP